MAAHVHGEECSHSRVRDPGAVAMLATGGFLFLAPFVNAAIGGPHIGGPVLCGMRSILGIPCPLCGMTTSFTFAARGDLHDAFRAAPLGPVLWLLALGCAVLGATLLVRGRALDRSAFPGPVRAALTRWWAWLPVLVVVSWAYQIARVNFWHLYV